MDMSNDYIWYISKDYAAIFCSEDKIRKAFFPKFFQWPTRSRVVTVEAIETCFCFVIVVVQTVRSAHIIIIIIIIVINRHELGLDRPVSAPSNCLFIVLPRRLLSSDL